MNWRGKLFCAAIRLKGRTYPHLYQRFLREDLQGVSLDVTRDLLVRMLNHCQRCVPYYAQAIEERGLSFRDDPFAYLSEFPILTRNLLRDHFEQLKSADLARRTWHYNTTGGSTGTPLRFVQDREFQECAYAITWLFSKWAGKDVGDMELLLWGSERDVFEGSIGWRNTLNNIASNRVLLNAFRMTPDKMRQFLNILNVKKPRLIISYAQTIYDLAQFAEQEHLSIVPQSAIITSAGTLHAFMREKIMNVFQCPVYNRYGSRELSIIACERPGCDGLYVPPWTQYVEIVDDAGNPVPDGTEGNILVTSLTNFAMPLIRYQVGDFGALLPQQHRTDRMGGQALQNVSGRIFDNFRTRQGKVIPGEYFIHLLGVVLNTGQVQKFQVIQRSYDLILLKIVTSNGQHDINTEEIVDKIKLIMEEPCTVQIEFVDDIAPASSGKYRYTISECPM